MNPFPIARTTKLPANSVAVPCICVPALLSNVIIIHIVKRESPSLPARVAESIGYSDVAESKRRRGMKRTGRERERAATGAFNDRPEAIDCNDMFMCLFDRGLTRLRRSHSHR